MGGINCDRSNGRITQSADFAESIALYTQCLFAAHRHFCRANEHIESTVMTETQLSRVAGTHLRKALEEFNSSSAAMVRAMDMLSHLAADWGVQASAPAVRAALTEPYAEFDAEGARNIWMAEGLVPNEDAIWTDVRQAMQSEGPGGFWKLQKSLLAQVDALTRSLAAVYQANSHQVHEGNLQQAIRDLAIPVTPITAALMTLWGRAMQGHAYMCLISWSATPSLSGVHLTPTDWSRSLRQSVKV